MTHAASNIEEIEQNPEKFGAPTFEQFSKDPQKYLGRSDDILSSADRGSHLFRQSNLVKKHIYEIEGFRTKKIEDVERIAKENGIQLKDLDYRPEVMPLGGGQCDILVKFISKTERDRRNV